LIGALLVRDDGPAEHRVGRIVETEAYGGPEDLASHARFGSTGRNAVMAGPPGIAYVYLVYGMYDCLNVVTGVSGAPSAVLIRAVEPLAGLETMRAARLDVDRRQRRVRSLEQIESARRRLDAIPARHLARGPGLVGACFGVDPGWTGVDLCDPDSALRLEPDPAGPAALAGAWIVAGPRVGVAYAGEDWAGVPWRFRLAGHPSVSRAR
jgi:DNA-3-methyladenine glycosylase